MCGFILTSNTPEHRVPAALEAMSYRGADGRMGVVSRGLFTLGHVRLAIQDLSDESRQPKAYPGLDLAFVGEVFNAPDGVMEIDHIANTLVKLGPQGFHGFDGFWAIASVFREIAYVYTDHLGIKPVYYWPTKGVVCSELDPMFALEDRPELDEVYLANCVKFGYDYSGRTPYKGIFQVPPGHRLEVYLGGMRVTPYWDWSLVRTPEPTAANLRTLVDKAIVRRLKGLRDIGLLLSGGLDSSIIYYSLKAQGLLDLVHCLSVENGESEFLPYGVKALPVAPVSNEEAVKIMQTPLDLGSLLPQIQLARALKAQGLNVCLTGDGADELFGGYRRSKDYDSQASDVFCELPYYHLPRLDRVMMRETVEQRSPFLAPSVVAFALKTPRVFRTGKLILKNAYCDLLPTDILMRDKHPLKSAAAQTGIPYRTNLVEDFRNVTASA